MEQPGREMDADLPVIVYSTGKYVGINDISRIRSHAMRTVQHQKYEKKKNAYTITGHTALRPTQSLRFTDRQSEPDNVSQESLRGKLRFKGRENERHAEDRNLRSKVVKQAKNLGLGARIASQRVDPFDTFPQTIELGVMELFDCCGLPSTHCANHVANSHAVYDRWKCDIGKDEFVQITLKDSGLYHSFATISFHLWRNDAKNALVHENAAMRHVASKIALTRNELQHGGQQGLDVLLWTITRLALVKVRQI